VSVVCADGSQLVAGIGARVLVFDASDGELLHALKGHKVSVETSRGDVGQQQQQQQQQQACGEQAAAGMS
jgi:urocanate hydratase